MVLNKKAGDLESEVLEDFLEYCFGDWGFIIDIEFEETSFDEGQEFSFFCCKVRHEGYENFSYDLYLRVEYDEVYLYRDEDCGDKGYEMPLQSDIFIMMFFDQLACCKNANK